MNTGKPRLQLNLRERLGIKNAPANKKKSITNSKANAGTKTANKKQGLDRPKTQPSLNAKKQKNNKRKKSAKNERQYLITLEKKVVSRISGDDVFDRITNATSIENQDVKNLMFNLAGVDTVQVREIENQADFTCDREIFETNKAPTISDIDDKSLNKVKSAKKITKQLIDFEGYNVYESNPNGDNNEVLYQNVKFGDEQNEEEKKEEENIKKNTAGKKKEKKVEEKKDVKKNEKKEKKVDNKNKCKKDCNKAGNKKK